MGILIEATGNGNIEIIKYTVGEGEVSGNKPVINGLKAIRCISGTDKISSSREKIEIRMYF